MIYLLQSSGETCGLQQNDDEGCEKLTSAAPSVSRLPPASPTFSASAPHLTFAKKLISSIRTTLSEYSPIARSRATSAKKAKLPIFTPVETETTTKKEEEGSTSGKLMEDTDAGSLFDFEKDCQLTSSSDSCFVLATNISLDPPAYYRANSNNDVTKSARIHANSPEVPFFSSSERKTFDISAQQVSLI